MRNLFDLTGKVALVTGGTRGLGRSIAEHFAGAGAQVVAASENRSDCEAAEKDFAEAGLSIATALCDVTDDKAQRALVETTVARFGKLDILVANAGISGPMSGSTDLSTEDYRRVMAVNLDSIVRLCGFSIPHLKRAESPSIILMSSLAGLRGNAFLGPYALAKAALAQLARNLAVEHGPDNIRANAIAPGFIRTELAAPLLANRDFMDRRMSMTPLRRPGEPSEVAGAAVFLASAAGGFVTGHTLVVDGGTIITDGNL